jgi:hypothetical protein
MSTILSSTENGAASPAVSASVPALTPAELFNQRLSDVYGLSQRSNYVFGSPLGPFYERGHSLQLPRFVYFGPETHDESLRLAFLSGFDHTDLRGAVALVHFVERLALEPDLGQGLNLSFFPLIDAAGLQHGTRDRGLARASWATAGTPEVAALANDARVRSYHGFVRVETAPGEEVVTCSLRGSTAASALASGVELISSEDFEPLAVRWEAHGGDEIAADGPLTLVDDLPFRPFELTLRIPAVWSADLYREAVASILKRFILRYRSIQAWGQHL